MLFIGAALKTNLISGRNDRKILVFQVCLKKSPGFTGDGAEELLQEGGCDHHRKEAVVKGVVPEDIGKKTGNHHPEAMVVKGPGGMLQA